MEDYFENVETTDVKIDPIEVVNRVLLMRMESLLESVSNEKNLCDEYSAGVVAEFLFKGNRFEVIYQLKKLIEYRTATPYVEADRSALIEQAARFMDYIKLEVNNPIRVKIRKLNAQLWQSYRNDIQVDIDLLRKQLHFNQRSRHEKKECLCFNN